MFRRRHQIPLRERLRRWLWPHIGWRRMGTYAVKRITRLRHAPQHRGRLRLRRGDLVHAVPGLPRDQRLPAVPGGARQLPGGRDRHTGRQSLDPSVPLAARATTSGMRCWAALPRRSNRSSIGISPPSLIRWRRCSGPWPSAAFPSAWWPGSLLFSAGADRRGLPGGTGRGGGRAGAPPSGAHPASPDARRALIHPGQARRLPVYPAPGAAGGERSRDLGPAFTTRTARPNGEVA